MPRMTLMTLLLAVVVVRANAQQNQNLFPGDSLPNVEQAAGARANALYGGAQNVSQQAIQQVKQAAQQTVGAATNTAQETANSWSRFLQPQPSKTKTLIDRWNTGTKNFLDKTKQVLTPPPLDKPLFTMPSFDGRFLQNVKLPSFSKSGTKNRSLLPAIFRRQPPESPQPLTVQDYLGLDRPQ